MANYADKRKKKLKTSKASSGAQLFMSDEAKEQMRVNRAFEGTDAEKLIRKSITNRMLEGKMIPEESGKLQANTVTDMISRSYGNDTQKFMMGGEVRPGDVRDSGKRGKCY